MVYSRAGLETKSMKELRKIGNPMGAKDTDKSELIDEILVKQPRPKDRTDTERLIERIELACGDLVQTYEMRDEILRSLKKLNSLEKKE